MNWLRERWRRFVEYCRDPYAGPLAEAEREIKQIEDWVKAGCPNADKPAPWRQK